MNPNAKEFVPAHILKKRQDEADLAEQLDQVGLSNGETSSSNTSNDKQTNESRNVQDNSKNETGSPIDKKDGQHDKDEQQSPHSNGVENHTRTNNHVNNNQNGGRQHNNINNNNNNHDLGNNNNNNDDDSHLLNAGENFCEFNGEQFIIPASDDEYEDEPCPEDLPKAGYDFGNTEDNDNEDVCNAYQQFLDSLPDD